tara:strand:- start:123 stop:410 length:288 start_codon:yes stop_codon:yes gene_type:complete
MRLGHKQIYSLDWVGRQIHEHKHGYSYLETSVGWGKPHEGRVIQSLSDKGLIICYDSGNGTGRVMRSIPNEGAFTAQMTELGYKVWKEKCGEVTA